MKTNNNENNIELKWPSNIDADYSVSDINSVIGNIREKIDYIQNITNELLVKKEELENIKLNTGNIKALEVFTNINDFDNKTEGLYSIDTWCIQYGSYSERASRMTHYDYYEDFKTYFNNKKLTNKPINDEQVISFFDTMALMKKLLDGIEDFNLNNEMKIIMEYVVPEKNKNRVDYMLVYRNCIYLLEFGKAKSLKDVAETQREKIEQVRNYREYLNNNLINGNVKLFANICVYLDESTSGNRKFNLETLETLRNQIVKTLKCDNQKTAFELLCEIS